MEKTMKTLEQLIETLMKLPEAEWEPETYRWRDEANLSEEEYEKLLSQMKVENVFRALIEKRLEDRGAKPEQKVGELITKEEVVDLFAAVKVMPQESNTKH
jgi:hypothetical protein